MQTHCDKDEIRETWLPKYDDEDSPASLMQQLAWLNQIGFEDIDIIMKHYNYSVLAA